MPTKKKTTSKRTKVTVHELKQHEKKYTYLFAGMFIALFVYLGYTMFVVPNHEIAASMSDVSNEIREEKAQPSVAVSSDIVALGENDSMSQQEGFLTKSSVVKLQNDKDEPIEYRLKLVKDHFLEKRCGCSNNYTAYVWVSMGDKISKLSDLENGVVYEGVLAAREEKVIPVQYWFDENLPEVDEDIHFHGHFELEY